MKITIPINYKFFLFLLAIEIITIPFVALFNTYTAFNNLLMDILGFTLGFICGIVMIYLMQRAVLKFISQELNLSIKKIQNKLYITLLFALVLGIMFFIQTKLNDSKYPSLTGGLSAGLAIFITLNINLVINKLWKNSLSVIDDYHVYYIYIDYFDICYISFIAFIYELFAYEISGLWIAYNNYRFFYGILSAIFASLFGYIAVLFTVRYLDYTPYIHLNKQINK